MRRHKLIRRNPLRGALRKPHRTGEPRLRQHHHKLLASEPRHEVHRTHRLDQQSRQLSQHVVAHQVTACVVDLLEMIEVDHQHGHGRLVTSGALHFGIEPHGQRPPIQDLRQRVRVGQHFEPRIVGPRGLDHLRPMDRRDRRLDHAAGELHILLRERRLVGHATQKEHARLHVGERKRHGDRRPHRHLGAMVPPHDAHFGKQRVALQIFDEHRLARFQRATDFRIKFEPDFEVAQRGRVECRGHHADLIARLRKNHRAAREVQRARHAAREHMVDLVARQIAGHIVENVYHLAARLRFIAGALQLLFCRFESALRAHQQAMQSELRLDARHQLPRPERLAHKVRGTKAERPLGHLVW